MIWYILAIVVGLVMFLRRVLRPRITVAHVNGVWLATVTGVFAKREYVRTSVNEPRDYGRCNWWLETSHGHALSRSHSVLADNLVEAYVALKPVRDYAGGA
jgi:hypothetical protein